MKTCEANYDNLVLSETVARGIDIVGECSFSKGDVVYYDEDNKTVKLLSDSSQEPYGVVADDITLEEEEEGSVSIYIKGKFNAYMLNFGESVTFENVTAKMDKVGLIGRYAQPAK